MVKDASFQIKIFDMMKEITGAVNTIAVPRLFCRAMGGLTGGTFLAQLVYWCDKGSREDGWIYKTTAEWTEEIFMSGYEIKKASKVLEDAGVLETTVKKANGSPTLHYKLLREPFINWLFKFFNNENEIFEKGNSNISKSLTKTTFPNTTAKNTTTSKNVTPVVVPVVAPIIKNNEDKLPKGIKPALVNKLTALHGADTVARQLKNLKTEQSKRTVKNPAGWLTTACNEGFDSKVEADLFAVQENKDLESKLVEKLESDSSAPHEFTNPSFMQALIAKHGCVADMVAGISANG